MQKKIQVQIDKSAQHNERSQKQMSMFAKKVHNQVLLQQRSLLAGPDDSEVCGPDGTLL